MKDTVSINLRLPTELHARLKAQADNDQRSLNSEIVWLLDNVVQETS